MISAFNIRPLGTVRDLPTLLRKPREAVTEADFIGIDQLAALWNAGPTGKALALKAADRNLEESR